MNAAGRRRGVKGLRDEGVKGATRRFWMLNFSPRSRPRQEYGVETLTRGFWILNFELCRGEKVRMCKSRGCGTRPDAGCDGCFEENVVGVADLA